MKTITIQIADQLENLKQKFTALSKNQEQLDAENALLILGEYLEIESQIEQEIEAISSEAKEAEDVSQSVQIMIARLDDLRSLKENLAELKSLAINFKQFLRNYRIN